MAQEQGAEEIDTPSLLLSYDLQTGECLYGYGADSVGAIHCLGINEDRDCIVTGGDSG